ncbi:MAG: hypothetical protein GY847_14455 [Proteobacteria bacterium]|nr:hypothetical protein [Pseudomonadota bacterium]
MKISILALLAGVIDLAKLLSQANRMRELERDIKALIQDACDHCGGTTCPRVCFIGKMRRKYFGEE